MGLVVVVVAGLVLRAAPWWRAHALLGQQEYDDAVYYASAKLLLHGQLPYRDFTLLHPPGVPVLLLPFAVLGSIWGDAVGLALARVTMLAVATTNMLLIYTAVLFGAGGAAGAGRVRWAALLGVALYAFAPTAVTAEHTVLLEPLVTAFCLSATVLLLRQPPTRRSAFAAGLLVMTGLNVKVFGATYLVMIVVLLLVGRRALLPAFLAGLAAVGVLDVLMLVLAPGAFLRDVVTTQLTRPTDVTVHGAARVATAFGLARAPAALALALLTLLGGSVAMLAVLAVRSRRPALPFFLGLSVLTAVALTTSRSFFPHYGAFLAAPFAVTIGLALALSPVLGCQLRVISLAAAIPVLAWGTAGSVLDSAAYTGQPDPASITTALPAGSCLYYQTASAAIAVDRLAVPTRACPAWIDGRGVRYAETTRWPQDRPFYPAGFTTSTRWQAGLREQLQHADYLLLAGDPATITEWNSITRSYVTDNFHKIVDVSARRAGRLQLWRR